MAEGEDRIRTAVMEPIEAEDEDEDVRNTAVPAVTPVTPDTADEKGDSEKEKPVLKKGQNLHSASNFWGFLEHI